MNKKYYEIKWLANILKILTILLIFSINIEMNLKIMLVFAYFMLFRQERWHKHLFIMFIMIVILTVSTGGHNSTYKWFYDKIESY